MRWLRAAAFGASLALIACVPTHASVSFSTWTTVPPPIPLVEVVPSSTGSGYVWINGYWWWDGNQYVWIRGHWARRPVAGYVWIPSGWVFVGGEYRFVAGRWAPPVRRTHVRYVHPVPRVRVRPGVRYRTHRQSIGGTIGGSVRRRRR